MRIILILYLLIIINGCSIITNRASVQKDFNKHYVEIYGGGFTTESAFQEELADFTRYICGTNSYEVKSKRIVGALAGSLPGATCEYRGCSDHLIMKVELDCEKTPAIEIHPKEENSRWLDPEKDKIIIEDLQEDDYVMRELVSLLGKPDSIYFNGNNEVIWQYTDRGISVLFERNLLLTGYQTRKMIIKQGLLKRPLTNTNHNQLSPTPFIPPFILSLLFQKQLTCAFAHF